MRNDGPQMEEEKKCIDCGMTFTDMLRTQTAQGMSGFRVIRDDDRNGELQCWGCTFAERARKE